MLEFPQTTTITTQVVVDGHDSGQEPMVKLSQQQVVQITLSGLNLCLTIFAICISIHFLQPSLACMLLALSPIPLIVYRDYLNFLSLGPGGTPSTFYGYLKITTLRLFALPDPYTPATIAEKVYPPIGYYHLVQSWSPTRKGPRPTIAGIAPQRQIDQDGCPDMYQLLRTSLINLATRHPESFRIGQSCFEKKGLALFARDPINSTCRGEIVHVHHSDRSMHMNLHPDDAKIVLEEGWGERHPLARGGWMKQYVPREFLMVYSPRNRAELGVIIRIIEAAQYWVSGKLFEITIDSEQLEDPSKLETCS
jgi:hypothetical protein